MLLLLPLQSRGSDAVTCPLLVCGSLLLLPQERGVQYGNKEVFFYILSFMMAVGKGKASNQKQF